MGAANSLTITGINDNEIIHFAAAELAKYLNRISPDISINLSVEHNFDPSAKRTVWIGLSSCFPDIDLPVADPEMDDAYFIQIQQGVGIISGINPRSVLMAVYRFLFESGCRWIRPGVDGELIPQKELTQISVLVKEKASYRHRGICIEGAVSFQNVADLIDWLPKVGFNAYFIQFREAYSFFNRWYTHQYNPLVKGQEFTPDDARELVRKVEIEIKKRGLIYHAVGHGWTCEPFGIPGLSWDQKVKEVPPETARYLAEVNGKRTLWEETPLNTQLCYSNPEVRQIMIQDIIDYIRKANVIDVLHFWLADGMNNHCECPECQKAIPSDFYIQILNELDERLSIEGLDTKIVFLLYVDLLWPPLVQRLKNPGRFILMFAPITRSYDRPFENKQADLPMPAYTRNHLKFPTSVAENLIYLKAWQAIFPCDSFDFDYHLMWAHYFDPGYYQIARVISEDAKNLKTVGLNGLISCQVQRAFLPNGLPMAVMAKTLWNDQSSFEEIVRDYFLSAFGADGEQCRQYLSEMPHLLTEFNIWEEQFHLEDLPVKMTKLQVIIKALQTLADKNLGLANECQAKSWQYLQLYLEISTRFAAVFEARSINDQSKTALLWEDLKTFVWKHEEEIQPFFDVFEFTFTLESMNKKVLNLA